MRNSPGNDLILGEFAGRNTHLGLSRTKRDKHLYVCGNTYRLIVAMYFNSRMAFTLRFLSHAEYDKDRWKDKL